ncbi:mucin-2-like [Saccostrea echinata]|uniref:mucin-2-like n=1 Tax=Saccostrea echinata TaxID=191078 RepID=UPI002A7F3CCF|nr:mucin-2-like [Saccostrea echinata]
MRDCINGEDEMNCTYTCTQKEFTCDSGKCIPITFKCDGNMDCGVGDNSDETNCGETPCARVRNFRCGKNNTNCLPISLKCDKHDDCGDGSDEVGCNCTCSSTEFTCSSSCECIKPTQRCDGTLDCRDGSDEMECPCTLNEFTCDNEKCINGTQHCDGVYDCSDKSDEKDCVTTTTATTTTPISTTPTSATPCVSEEIMSNPALLPSSKIFINPAPKDPLTAENLRPGSTAALEIDSNTATISVDLTTTENPDGSVIKSLNIAGDQSNVQKLTVSYKVSATASSKDFTGFTGIGPVIFPDNFKVAAVDVTLMQRTDTSEPYRIKLNLVACVHGGSVATNIFTTSGITSTLGSLTPVTIDMTFNTPEPPKVTDVVFTVTNGKNVQVSLKDENGLPTTMTPTMTSSGRIILDYNGQPSKGISITVTPKSITEPVTVKETEVKACTQPAVPTTTAAPSTPSGPTPSVTGPTTTPTGSTTTPATTCADAMLPVGVDVLSPSSSDIPTGDLPKILSPTGATTTTDNPTPTVVFDLNKETPPRVTEVSVTVTNAERVDVELEEPNGEKITKTPVIQPNGVVTVNFNGEEGTKITVKITKKDTSQPSTVSDVKVKACIEATTTASTTTIGTTPSVPTPSGPTPSVSVPTTTPSAPTTTPTTTCADAMLPVGVNVLSPSSSDIPTGDLPKILSPTGATTTTDNPTPTVVFDLNKETPPRVTEVSVTVTNAERVDVELEEPNGEKITKTPVIQPNGVVTVNFNGEEGTKITVKITKKDTSQPSTVSDVKVKACIEATTTASTTTIGTTPSVPTPSGPTPSVSVPTTTPSAPTTTPTTTCADAMLPVGVDVLSPSSSDIPTGDLPKILSPTGATTTTDNPTPTVVFDLNKETPPRVTEVSVTVTNAERVDVELEEPNGEKITKTPVIQPNGVVTVNFNGEEGTKITVKITKKDTSQPSTVSDVKVKACIEATTTASTTTIGTTPSVPTPSGPTPSVSVPTTTPSAPTTTPTTTCADAMLPVGVDVLSPSSSDIPTGDLPKILSPTGATTTTDNPTPTVVFDLNKETPPRVTEVSVTVTNAERVDVELEEPNGEKITKTPVIQPNGVVTVNFNGEEGTKITVKITKKDTSQPSTVSDVKVKACIEATTTASTTTIGTTPSVPTPSGPTPSVSVPTTTPSAPTTTPTTTCADAMLPVGVDVLSPSSSDIPTGDLPKILSPTGATTTTDNPTPTVVFDLNKETPPRVTEVSVTVTNAERVDVELEEPNGEKITKTPVIQPNGVVTVNFNGEEGTKITVKITKKDTSQPSTVSDVKVKACIEATTTASTTTIGTTPSVPTPSGPTPSVSVPTTTPSAPTTTSITTCADAMLPVGVDVLSPSSSDIPTGDLPKILSPTGATTTTDNPTPTVVFDLNKETPPRVTEVSVTVTNAERVDVELEEPNGEKITKTPVIQPNGVVTVNFNGEEGTKITVKITKKDTSQPSTVSDVKVKACIEATTTASTTTIGTTPSVPTPSGPTPSVSVPTTTPSAPTTTPTTTCADAMLPVGVDVLSPSSSDIPTGDLPKILSPTGATTTTDNPTPTVVFDLNKETPPRVTEVSVTVTNAERVDVELEEPNGEKITKTPVIQPNGVVTVNFNGEEGTKITVKITKKDTSQPSTVSDVKVKACIEATTTASTTTIGTTPSVPTPSGPTPSVSVPTTTPSAPTTTPTTTCADAMLPVGVDVLSPSSSDIPTGDLPKILSPTGATTTTDNPTPTVVFDLNKETPPRVTEVSVTVTNAERVDVELEEPNGEKITKTPVIQPNGVVTVNFNGEEGTKITVKITKKDTSQPSTVSDVKVKACIEATTTASTTTIGTTPSVPTPSGPTPSVSVPTTTPSAPTTTSITTCADAMLPVGVDVLSPSSSDIPTGDLPKILSPTGATTTTDNPTPTVVFDLNKETPPRVTEVSVTVTNAERVDVELEEPNGEKITKTPVIQPNGVVTVNFNGEEGTKITVKITKKDTSQPSTVSDVKVKACIEATTTASTTTIGTTPSVPTPSGPTPSVSVPTTTPSAPTTTPTTTCADAMLPVGVDVLSPSSSDIPTGDLPKILSPTGATTTTDNPTPTVVFDLNKETPPRVTEVSVTVTNAERVDVELEEPNGEKITKTPVIQPNGVVTVNFNGEEGTKITVKITKKDTSQPSTVSDVKVKACIEATTIASTTTIGTTPSVPTPSGPTPSVSVPTTTPSAPTTTPTTTCADAMLPVGVDVLSPSSSDIPTGDLPKILSPTGATTTTDNPTPTVVFDLNKETPPRVTEVSVTVTNAERVDVELEEPNGEKITKTPVIQPNGVVTVNFNGEEGTKITVKITKKDTSQPSTVSDVKVKACIEATTTASTTTIGTTPSVPTPSGPTPSVSVPTTTPSAPTTTPTTTCADAMLPVGVDVLSPSSSDIPTGDLPKILSPTGATTTTDNPTPTVVFDLNKETPPRVTEVSVTVTNAERVDVELEEPNGEKITKTPVIQPNGVVTVNFNGEEGTKITVKITKKDTSQPSTVSDVKVKACIEVISTTQTTEKPGVVTTTALVTTTYFVTTTSSTPSTTTICTQQEGMDDFSQIPSSNIVFPNNVVSPSDLDKVRPGNVDGPLTIKQTSSDKPVVIKISLTPDGVEVGEINVSPDELLPESKLFPETGPADLKGKLATEVEIRIQPVDATADIFLVISIKACFGGITTTPLRTTQGGFTLTPVSGSTPTSTSSMGTTSVPSGTTGAAAFTPATISYTPATAGGPSSPSLSTTTSSSTTG